MTSFYIICEVYTIGIAYAKKVKQHEYGMTLPVPLSGLSFLSGKDTPVSQESHGLSNGHSGWTLIFLTASLQRK